MYILSRLALILGVIHILPFWYVMWATFLTDSVITNYQVSGAAVLAVFGWAFIMASIKEWNSK